MLRVFAEPASSRAARNPNGRRKNAAGTNGNSANRRGSGAPTGPVEMRRYGSQSMGDMYRATGMTRLGGNARTRGRIAPITPVGRGR